MTDHRNFPPLRLPDLTKGKRTWRTDDLVRAVEHHRDFAAAMLPACEDVIRRACADVDSFVRSPGLDGTRGGGDEDGQVPRAVLAMALINGEKQVGWREDPVRLAMHNLSRAVKEIHYHQTQLSNALAVLQGIDPVEARRLVEAKPIERGCYCENKACGRWVAGGTKDPIRSGRCSACAQQYRRTGEDRTVEMIERCEGKAVAS